MHPSGCPTLAGLVTLGVAATAACAVLDAFAPAGPGDVTLVYVGDTELTVGQPRPFTVTALVQGVPLPGLRLRVENTNPDVDSLNFDGDSLFPLRVGRDTLVIRLDHSSAGTDMPTRFIPLRVTGGPPPGP